MRQSQVMLWNPAYTVGNVARISRSEKIHCLIENKDSLETLVDGLKFNYHVTFLSLQGCNFTEAMVANLMERINTLRTLTTLELDFNGEVDLSLIISNLRNNFSVNQLQLTCDKFQDRYYDDFKKLLYQNRCIQSLTWCHNHDISPKFMELVQLCCKELAEIKIIRMD